MYPRLLEEPVLFPELLLETTEMALAIASTADRRSAKVFLSDLSASEKKQHGYLAWKRESGGSRQLNWYRWADSELEGHFHPPFFKIDEVQNWETLGGECTHNQHIKIRSYLSDVIIIMKIIMLD